jgi:hypothetical protein
MILLTSLPFFGAIRKWIEIRWPVSQYPFNHFMQPVLSNSGYSNFSFRKMFDINNWA